MRDYGAVSPQFWIGETGKKLRGDPIAQVIAVYLMTSPHSNSTGVYHCPLLYMAHETGSPIEGASKALARLIEEGFCHYEEASETVFVVRMAAFQMGEQLATGDKRVAWVRREVEKMPKGLKNKFISTYGDAYKIADMGVEKASPLEAPSKPLRSQGQRQRQDKDKGKSPADAGATPVNGHAKSKKHPLPIAFVLDPDLSAYATQRLPGVDPVALFESFTGKAQAKGWQYANWRQAFQEFVRNSAPASGHFAAGQYPKAGAGGRLWE